MINDLIKLATHLDSKGLHKEADYVDRLLKRLAQETKEEDPSEAQRMAEVAEDLRFALSEEGEQLDMEGPSTPPFRSEHKVGKGETLEGIAKHYFKKQNVNMPKDLRYEKWEDLYYETIRVNKIKNPELIQVGQKINIPSKEFYYE